MADLPEVLVEAWKASAISLSTSMSMFFFTSRFLLRSLTYALTQSEKVFLSSVWQTLAIHCFGSLLISLVSGR